MILDCANCRRQYDAGHLPPGEAVRCECGDLLCVPAAEDLEDPAVIEQFVQRWATSCETTAEALKVDGGWEFIADSAVVRIEHDTQVDRLTIVSTLLSVPETDSRRLALFGRLLELNYRQTGEARFAVAGSQVLITFTRPTLGLDYHEFHRAVEEVAQTADDFADELHGEFNGGPAGDGEIDLAGDEL